MITEKGTLSLGVEVDGKEHRAFELRPQIVRDSVEILENDRARANDGFFGVCLVAKQLVALGDLPAEKITPELVMSLTEVDFTILMKAKEALETRLRSFRA